MHFLSSPHSASTPSSEPGTHDTCRVGFDLTRPLETKGKKFEKAVVFRHSFAALGTACFDAPYAHRDRQVSDEGVVRLSGAVGDDAVDVVLSGKPHRIERLRERADLVHLDDDAGNRIHVDGPLKERRVRHGQVVADDTDP